MSDRPRLNISPTIKQQILSELSNDDIVVADIARKYNVPVKNLYAWRSLEKKKAQKEDVSMVGVDLEQTDIFWG